MAPSKKSTKKSTTVLIATTLAITILAGGLVEAKPKILHKADISHPKGSSPWPDYGEKPETNTPEVKAWVKLVNWANVPKLPIRHTKSPGDPPDCPKNDPPKADCWWTCTGCFAPDDVVDCPGKKQWGLTFDDGPEPGVTEKLLDLLQEKNVTATFFVTGMKSTKAPWLLKETIDRGHHLASHTWSHSGLTTMTNAEIVAELKWTEKYIFDHTGYKVKYFRPPYGDVDNRVRAIARELGFKTVIWSDDWDTQDWQLPENTISQKQIVGIFKDGLHQLPKRKKGVITLEHDGDQQMVTMARTLLTMGMKNGMTPMDIPKCMGDPVGYNQVPKSALPPPKPAPVPPKPAAVAPKPAQDQPVQSTKVPQPATESEDLPSAIAEESSKKKSAASRVAASAGFTVAGWTIAAVLASLVL
ncbi:chitin deacetylase [Podila horticola]|nr:chitin deacetylase [Podila horticola]